MKGTFESEESRVNVKKRKMMINSENAENVVEVKSVMFPCPVYRKGVGSNSFLCQFSRLWGHEKCSVIRSKLKVNSKLTWT